MKDDTGEIFTLDELAAAKKIPAFTVGGARRFQRRGIDQRSKRRTVESRGNDIAGELRGKDG